MELSRTTLLEMARGRRRDRHETVEVPTETAPSGRRATPVWTTAALMIGEEAPMRRLVAHLEAPTSVRWASARDVERRAVLAALSGSGVKLVNRLSREAVIAGCVATAAALDADGDALADRLVGSWSHDPEACRVYLRGLLGEFTRPTPGVTREGFCLMSALPPPLRVLRGSLEYAGRRWCRDVWGTPEDVVVMQAQSMMQPGARGQFYIFEATESAPIRAFGQIARQHPGCAIALVAAEPESGHIITAHARGEHAREGLVEVGDLKGCAPEQLHARLLDLARRELQSAAAVH